MISSTTIFYIYDKAILDWLASLTFNAAIFGSDFNPATETVPVQWSKKDSIFADAKPDKFNKELLAQYPIVSLDSDDPQPDMPRRQANNVHKWDVINYTDPDTLATEPRIKKIHYPKPFVVNYQIDLIARSSAHIKQMYLPLLNEFETNVKYLTVTLPDPIKAKYLKLELTSVNDNSDLEIDEQNRFQLYRKTLTLAADIWIFKDDYPTLSKRIQQVELGYKVDSTVVNESDIIT